MFLQIMASRQLSRILREAASSNLTEKSDAHPQPPPQAPTNSELSTGVIIGISIGVAIGALLAVCVLLCWRWQKKSLKIGSERRGLALPIRVNGVNSSVILSDSNLGSKESPSTAAGNFANTLFSSWFGSSERFLASSGVTKFSYGYIHNTTHPFCLMFSRASPQVLRVGQRSMSSIVSDVILRSKLWLLRFTLESYVFIFSISFLLAEISKSRQIISRPCWARVLLAQSIKLFCSHQAQYWPWKSFRVTPSKARKNFKRRYLTDIVM